MITVEDAIIAYFNVKEAFVDFLHTSSDEYIQDIIRYLEEKELEVNGRLWTMHFLAQSEIKRRRAKK